MELNHQILSIQILNDLPEDILGVIAGLTGELGCTVLGHVSRDWAAVARGQHCLDPDIVCGEAARVDQFEVLKWAESAGYVMWAYPADAAANGNLEMLEWIQENGDCWESDMVYITYNCATVAGHLHVLKWLRLHGYEPNWNMLCKAARHGHQHIVEWLVAESTIPNENDENIRFTIDDIVFMKAAKGGHFELLKWMKENGPQPCPWTDLTSIVAAGQGSVEILEWLYAEGCPFDDVVGIHAASGGHVPALKWLRGVGFEQESAMCNAAAANGHAHVLEWLDEVGCPSSDVEYTFAASRGHIHVVEWLIEKGRTMDRSVMCRHAASGGHIEMLKWLRENGHPWDDTVCLSAVEWGHLDALMWLRAEGCPCDLEYCAELATVPRMDLGLTKIEMKIMNTKNGLNIIKYLHDEGCPLDNPELCANAAEVGDLMMLKWLRGKGCPWDEDTCDRAADHSYVLDWIHANGCPCEHTAVAVDGSVSAD